MARTVRGKQKILAAHHTRFSADGSATAASEAFAVDANLAFPPAFVPISISDGRMKKKLLILTVILVILAIASLFSVRPAFSPHVEMGFYGWTNSGAGTEALFGISNHPNVTVVLHSITRPGANTSNLEDERLGNWAWSRWEPWGITSAVHVKTTNEPLRVIFEFRERAGGLRRVTERIKEMWGRLTGNEREFFTGHKFFVTNETRISNAHY